MKKRLIFVAGLVLALMNVVGCAGPPAPTSTPTPASVPTTTPTPPPAVTYVEGRFVSGPIAGKEITVPVGSSVDVNVVLNATAIMRGELKVEVWKAAVGSPHTIVMSYARATTLSSGTQDVPASQFVAEDLTGTAFSHYYLKAYWSGAPLVADPRTGEGVRTTPGSATPTPTLLPVREWNLEQVQVDGSTVTVSIRVFAGIDVWATLDGKRADEVQAVLPVIRHVFRNVTPGKHTVEVRDVVGHRETAEVVVTMPGIPDWLAGLIQRLENEPVANPPSSITRYEYKDQIVYYVPPRFADIFSDLYDANGNLMGHPDGGITGRGDGRFPDFFNERRNETVIWKDQRAYDPGRVQELAPIESVKVSVLKSLPPQYSVLVVSGLPNACYSFAGYRQQRSDGTIQIEIVNWKPKDPGVACAQVYGTVETNILLAGQFEAGKTYSVVVNGVTETFVAQ